MSPKDRNFWSDLMTRVVQLQRPGAHGFGKGVAGTECTHEAPVSRKWERGPSEEPRGFVSTLSPGHTLRTTIGKKTWRRRAPQTKRADPCGSARPASGDVYFTTWSVEGSRTRPGGAWPSVTGTTIRGVVPDRSPMAHAPTRIPSLKQPSLATNDGQNARAGATPPRCRST